MTVRHSIKWKLQVWFAFLLACTMSAFAFVAYQLHRNNRFGEIDEELERRVALVSAEMRRPSLGFERGPRGGMRDEPNRGYTPQARFGDPNPDGREGRFRPREPRITEELIAQLGEGASQGYYFAIWNRENTFLAVSTNVPVQLELPFKVGNQVRPQIRSWSDHREMFHFTGPGIGILVGKSIALDLAANRKFSILLLVAAVSVLGLGVGGGWLMATRSLHPLEEICGAASRISEGNLSERIASTHPQSEVGRLAAVLNSTFERLEAAFEQKKRFTADASHELRTPIAILIAETQSALARDRSPAEYRETIEACLDTAQQMRTLTNSLLELARFDAGEECLQCQEFELGHWVKDQTASFRSLAEESNVELTVSTEEVRIVADQSRMRQVVVNLISNAIFYNRPGGSVKVKVTRSSQNALITISDTGCGISSDDLPKIFDRFYRSDKARGRGTGRSGLGLSISKMIVEAHEGKISVSSLLGEGSEFIVCLPLGNGAMRVDTLSVFSGSV